MITRTRRSRRQISCRFWWEARVMPARFSLICGFLLISALACAQNASVWPCSDDLTKVEGDSRRVRVSVGVMQALAQNKTLPDISDLKDKKLSSTVILRIIIGKDGAVRCVDPVQGDADLFPRSVEAARQWRFRPYLLNGQPIMVQTRIEFVFKKGKVKDLQAER
jgi:hypothetical protein